MSFNPPNERNKTHMVEDDGEGGRVLCALMPHLAGKTVYVAADWAEVTCKRCLRFKP